MLNFPNILYIVIKLQNTNSFGKILQSKEITKSANIFTVFTVIQEIFKSEKLLFSSVPLRKDGNPRFATVPLKPVSDE